MLSVSIESREAFSGHEFAIDSQVGMAPRGCPLCKVLVDALALNHKGREQANALPEMVSLDDRQDGLRRLRCDWNLAGWALLLTQFHIEQAQEVMYLGECPHRALAAPTAGPLLDGHCGGYPIDGVDLWSRGWLDELTGIGIERLEIATLSFCK